MQWNINPKFLTCVFVGTTTIKHSFGNALLTQTISSDLGDRLLLFYTHKLILLSLVPKSCINKRMVESLWTMGNLPPIHWCRISQPSILIPQSYKSQISWIPWMDHWFYENSWCSYYHRIIDSMNIPHMCVVFFYHMTHYLNQIHSFPFWLIFCMTTIIWQFNIAFENGHRHKQFFD